MSSKKIFKVIKNVFFMLFLFSRCLNLCLYLYISQNKRNQRIKFGQVVEYNNKNIFVQKLCRKWGTKTSSRPLFVFLKALYELKAIGLDVSFNLFQQSSPLHTIRSLLVEGSVIIQHVLFKNMMNNYAWTLIIWQKEISFVL